MDDDRLATLVRPQGHLFRQGVLGVLALMAPVFVVLYSLTVPDGPWPAVIVGNVLVLLLVGLAILGYRHTAILATPVDITERSFFGGVTRVPVGDIGMVLRVRSLESSGVESHVHLFVCDREGRQVVRMRGQFWATEDIDAIIATLGLRVRRINDPISKAELLADYPGLLYWFERKPVLAGLAFAGATALVALLIVLLLWAAGLSGSG